MNYIASDIPKIKRNGLLLMAYRQLLNYIKRGQADLVWQPNTYSQSAYSPYWRVNAFGYIWYVTQEGKVFAQTNSKNILDQITVNILQARKFNKK